MAPHHPQMPKISTKKLRSILKQLSHKHPEVPEDVKIIEISEEQRDAIQRGENVSIPGLSDVQFDGTNSVNELSHKSSPRRGQDWALLITTGVLMFIVVAGTIISLSTIVACPPCAIISGAIAGLGLLIGAMLLYGTHMGNVVELRRIRRLLQKEG